MQKKLIDMILKLNKYNEIKWYKSLSIEHLIKQALYLADVIHDIEV